MSGKRWATKRTLCLLIGLVGLLAGLGCATASEPPTPRAARTPRLSLEAFFATPTAPRTRPSLVSPPVSTPIAMPVAAASAQFDSYPLEFIHAQGAAPGEFAEASIRTVPGYACWLLYTPPVALGVPLGVSGLDRPVVAGGDGVVRWQWRVALGTPWGFASLDATCNDLKAREWIFIKLPP